MTLSELSLYFRKLTPLVILTIIILLILYFGAQLAILVISNNPEEEEDPLANIIETTFDQIPPPRIEGKTSEGLIFTLDNITGLPKEFAEYANVFFVPEVDELSFGFEENILLTARNLGFDITEIDYTLNNERTMATFNDENQNLQIDTRTYNFEYEYTNFLREDERVSKAIIPSESVIQETAINIMKSVGKYTNEFAQGAKTIIYLNLNPVTNELKIVEEPEEANLVEIDFMKADLEDWPIFAPRFFNSQNYIILLFESASEYQIVRAQVQDYKRSEEQVGVYPLKTAEEAYQTLLDGKGYVVSSLENVSDITIASLQFGYLDVLAYEEYVQPVYVYVGRENFVAYVPAVKDEWLTTTEPQIITSTTREEELLNNQAPDLPQNQQTISPTVPSSDTNQATGSSQLKNSPITTQSPTSLPRQPSPTAPNQERIQELPGTL